MPMIKDLKSMSAGTKVGGFPLLIKTARKVFRDGEGNNWQEVVFMDASGEMTGNILLEVYEPKESDYHKVATFHAWQSKTGICILDAEIQDTDERKKEAEKLVVFECFDLATPLTYAQHDELYEEDWKKLREEEIKGKIRHGIVCSMIRAGFNIHAIIKECSLEIKDLVEFILKGE